tara:strand:- start:653 stop:883 length:231 start_codon:yes stop_codon:yes gene_type:complete
MIRTKVTPSHLDRNIPNHIPLCDNPTCDAFGLPMYVRGGTYHCLDCTAVAPKQPRNRRALATNRYYAISQAQELSA